MAEVELESFEASGYDNAYTEVGASGTLDEDYATQDESIIDAWLTSAVWKIRPEPNHVIFAQPVKIAHHASNDLGA